MFTMSTVSRSAFLEDFVCAGASCEDTCCIGWGMQVDDGTWQRYSSNTPDIAKDITEENGVRVMKRDTTTGNCVRFSDGLCGIQKDHGTDYLGDACHFFPRITRQLGHHTIMTAALSCPEITRLSLYTQSSTQLRTTEGISRLPFTIKDYLPEGISADDALRIHQIFLDFATTPDHTTERTLAIISSVARSLAMIATSSWAAATPFYLKSAQSRLLQAEQHAEDPFNVLHVLVGLVDASPAAGRARLEVTINDIEQALCVSLNRKHGAITTTEHSLDALLMMEHQWRLQWAAPLQPILQQWLGVQMAVSLFPYAGFGNNPIEVITLIGMRFAMVKLGLMAHCYLHQRLPQQDETIRIIQGLSRFLEHLTSPELSLRICHETGWMREPRFRALIGDM
jgi:lysine-N-methylase